MTGLIRGRRCGGCQCSWGRIQLKREPLHYIFHLGGVGCLEGRRRRFATTTEADRKEPKSKAGGNVGKQREDRVFERGESCRGQSISPTHSLAIQWPPSPHPSPPRPSLPASVRAGGAQNPSPRSRSLPSARPTAASPTASPSRKVRRPSTRNGSSTPACGARSPSGRSRRTVRPSEVVAWVPSW